MRTEESKQRFTKSEKMNASRIIRAAQVSSVLRRRSFSELPRKGGRKLETAFDKLSADPRGKAAIERYGACLDRQLDDVSKNCCKIEFDELQKVFKELLENKADQKMV